MFSIQILADARDAAHEARQVLEKDNNQGQLVAEFLDRFEEGSRLFVHLQSKGNGGVSPLDQEGVRAYLYCKQQFSRCLAIYAHLKPDSRVLAHGAAPSPKHTRLMGMRENRFVTRWVLSRVSWIRSRLLGYRPHYQTPPLRQAILLSLSERSYLIKLRNAFRSHLSK